MLGIHSLRTWEGGGDGIGAVLKSIATCATLSKNILLKYYQLQKIFMNFRWRINLKLLKDQTNTSLVYMSFSWIQKQYNSSQPMS